MAFTGKDLTINSMKNVLRITGILISISIILFLLFRIPNKYHRNELIPLPVDTTQEQTTNIHLIITISADNNLYLNTEPVKPEILLAKIDSLGALGLNDSIILLNPDTASNIQILTEVMEILNASGKRLMVRK